MPYADSIDAVKESKEMYNLSVVKLMSYMSLLLMRHLSQDAKPVFSRACDA